MPTFIRVSDSSATVSPAQLADLVGVSRAAVSQWRQRYADFPATDGKRLVLSEAIAWLDSRVIPADRRQPDEAEGDTYGQRARQRLDHTRPTEASRTLRALEALAPEITGGALPSDYTYLLLCLAFLHQHDRAQWHQLVRLAAYLRDPGPARMFLQRVVHTVDEALGQQGTPTGWDVPPSRLRPVGAGPVRQVMVLAASLTPADVEQLHAALLKQVSGPNDVLWTPPSIARVMAGLLAEEASGPGVTVYDPYVRFGELPTEFLRTHPAPATVEVRVEHSRSAELRLAGIRLLATGTHPVLALTSAIAPPTGVDVVMANPPFGRQSELAWIRHCIESLATNGHAAVLMPYSTGFDQSVPVWDLRRELVEQGQVQAIVALPAQMFTTTRIGVCIWLLRRQSEKAVPVRFVDARELGKMSGSQVVLDTGDLKTIIDAIRPGEHELGVTVEPDVIRVHGYSLHPPEYGREASSRPSAQRAVTELGRLAPTAVSPGYQAGLDEGWPRHRLDELCEIRTGVPHQTLTAASDRAHTGASGVPVVRPRHLRHGLIDIGGARLADPHSLDRYQLRDGDVLCVRTGAMGQVAIVQASESGLLPHTNVRRLRVTDHSVLDPAYLSMYLRQPSVQGHIRERSVRSVTTSISVAALGGIEMPLPPLSEQHRILHAIEAFDEQITDLEQQLATVRRARLAYGKHLTDGTIVLDERHPW